MKKLLILSSLFIALHKNAEANHYYFAATTSGGSDSNTGTSSASPWNSNTKFNATVLNPGDEVSFNKGDTFTGEFIPNGSGTSGNPILIDTYGTGTSPIITLSRLTSWTGPTSGVYSKSISVHTGTVIFYEDGLPLLPEASSSACTDGKWYADGTGNTVYYKPASGDPTTHTITYGQLGSPQPGYVPLLDLSGLSYITVNGLTFNSAGIGIKTYEVSAGTSNLIIESCGFNYCQRAMFIMPGTNNNSYMTVTNCTFNYCQNDIDMYTWTAEGGNSGSTAGINQYCTIANNIGNYTGTIDGVTHWNIGTDFEFIGLQNFQNSTIANNTDYGGFHIGLSWYNITTNISSNNTISGNTWNSTGKGAILLIGDQVGSVYNYAYNNNTFNNNTIINSDYTGVFDGSVVIYQGANTTSQNYFYNNTLSGNKNLVYFAIANAPYFTVENNIVYNSGQYRFVNWNWSAKPATLTMDYNLYYEDGSNTGGASSGWAFSSGKTLSQMQALGMEAHSIISTNPLFVNSASNNYHLSLGSPAINAGVNVGLPFTGIAPDMGAFEFSTTGRPFIYSGKLIVRWH